MHILRSWEQGPHGEIAYTMGYNARTGEDRVVQVQVDVTLTAAASEPIRKLGDVEQAAKLLAGRLLDADTRKILEAGASLNTLGYKLQKEPPREFAQRWVRTIGSADLDAVGPCVAQLLKKQPPTT